jgi:hypothetical protein
MHVYQGEPLQGVSIVDFGLAINVTDGKATVEYNDRISDFYATLAAGGMVVDSEIILLDDDQLGWLDDNKTWVEIQIEDSK